MFKWSARFIKKLVRAASRQKENGESEHLDKELVNRLTKRRIPSVQQIFKVRALLSQVEKRAITAAVIIILGMGAWLGYTFYKNNVVNLPDYGGVLTEALIGQPKFINPILAQTNDTDLDIVRLTYSGLMKYDANLMLTTDLAESYTVDAEEKVFTFRLKENLFWEDGTPLNADDVIFTMQAIQDVDWQSPLLVSFKGISIDKIDERTVAFTLPKPFAPFLTLLTTGLIPKHIWEDIPPQSARLAEFNIKPIGNGPWKFSELTKDKAGNIHSYTLVANERYHEKRPYLEKMILKFFPDFTSGIEALNENQVMSLSFLPNDLARDLLKGERMSYHELELPQYTALFMNQKKNAFLKDKKIRQALAYSIDKQRLIDTALMGRGLTINSPILPSQIGFRDDLSEYKYDIGKARALLEEAGWQRNEAGIYAKDGAELAISLTTVEHSENRIVAEELEKLWRDAGFAVKLEIVSASEIQGNIIRQRNYDILLYGEIVGADPDPFPFWHSTQVEHPGLNLSQFKNNESDALLESARFTSDKKTREEKYKEFQKILNEELPAIFLYAPMYTYVQDKRIKNFGVSGLIVPADRFNNVTEWYLKTKKSIR